LTRRDAPRSRSASPEDATCDHRSWRSVREEMSAGGRLSTWQKALYKEALGLL
jgi:hypothetical protein